MTTKKATRRRPRTSSSDELRPEYHFDYSKARPNRVAARLAGDRLMVVLDPEVARVFRTSEAVNKALRALIDAVPGLKPSE